MILGITLPLPLQKLVDAHACNRGAPNGLRLSGARMRVCCSHGAGDRAELKWPMVTIWPRRDMNELSFLQHVDSVPFAFRYNARFAGMQFNGCGRFGLSSNPEASRNHVEYLVPIRMDFASVRCIIRNRDDPHRHAIDSGRRTGPMGSRGHREVAVNVEQVARNIDWDNSVYQSILLLGHDACQSPDEPR